jgi:hypothetical protein
MLIISTARGGFLAYSEWTQLPGPVSPGVLLRAIVQMKSYQKGPIDYLLVCLGPDKEWAFEEMLDMRRFGKNYFKRASPLLVELGRERETSLAHFYLENWEAMLGLAERINLKSRGFR